jgi:hypothetical protein
MLERAGVGVEPPTPWRYHPQNPLFFCFSTFFRDLVFYKALVSVSSNCVIDRLSRVARKTQEV